MDIEISLASVGEKLILQNLMHLYLFEYSTTDDMEMDDDTGMFRDPYLKRYWLDAAR